MPFSKNQPSWPIISIIQNVLLFICLFVRHTLSLCLTVFLPPLLEVQYPNFLDFRIPLRKNNGKKWAQIWKLLFIKCVKLPRAKKVSFFFANFASLSGFFWYWYYYLHWSWDSLSPVCKLHKNNFHIIFFVVCCFVVFCCFFVERKEEEEICSWNLRINN